MKLTIKHIILVSVLLFITGACTTEPTVGHEGGNTEVKLRMLVRTPGTTRPGTRAVAESEVNEISVLVFENTGSGFTYQYLVAGYSLAASTGTYDYEFLARLLPTTNPIRLYLIANAGSAVNAAVEDMSEEAVKAAVTMAYASAGFTDVLPMAGVVDLAAGINGDADVDAVLVRSAAKVEVINNASNFTLTSVKVYRANNLLQIIPDTLISNSVPTSSVPVGATRSVNSPTFTLESGAVSLLDQIYIPESGIPADADRRLTATAVVVGGRFAGSTETTYYRMDFIPNVGGQDNLSLYGQVLRNHLYRFTISGVLAPGWPSDDDASVNPSTVIDARIQVWDEQTVYTVFDDYDHFGVSTRSVRLGYSVGSEQSVAVDTSLDTYQAYWSDQDGNILDESEFISLGEDFEDPEGLYNASITATGDEIVFTALKPYAAATAQTKYLVVAAGRMRVVISVTQAPVSYANRAVSVFNSLNGIGSFGNYVTGLGWNTAPGRAPGERAYGLGLMLEASLPNEPQNFGPGKTVDMQGIYITGIELNNTMPRNYYQGADVLYLTYDNYPTATQVSDILGWLAENENRVLIMQFDNTAPNNTSGTNYTMMAALGLNRIAGGVTTAFDYAGAAAPDFVKYGPFGTLPDSFTYKCRDDIYGGIAPAAADAAGYIPILLNSAGNYLLSVNPQSRIVLCGDCDVYSNVNAGSTGYFLDFTAAGNVTINPANPAHVMMGNLWAWIVDVVLREE